MKQITKRATRFSSILLVMVALPSMAAANAMEETIFESGTLGPTAVTWADLENRTVPGFNVNPNVFVGVRFELSQPIVTSQIGGHFVEWFGPTFFGAIIELEGQNDFPNSSNLSTPDVLGVARLSFPNPSAEVFGDLVLSLEPGWYALVFGSGRFGTSGLGGSVRNGIDIGDPSYIANEINLNWFNIDDMVPQYRFKNHRFVVRGTIVPEPTSLTIACLMLFVFWSFRLREVSSS